mmetsp:Transcript_15618/g.21942  ORF Transcript_15618/g.21942 Transcript_15618/m.21942 type:complete len:132 (+) Transcript_15618:58-453(+)|eukprot:CAMPEP_0175103526 /NCGR_PEP_ID=MMETSP0086_2-20121207/9140_1 /TAXON_ID=136419 /ORGANISM="Unknown Unknown, Strain D1" /LENGTH=131 /DNA_ID=CAMNT_0016378655 /DNA_START=40 /DNA_END=435 /DNA_ORIENTATION=+
MANPRARLGRAFDRSKHTPLLLRVFINQGELHKNEDFAERGKEPECEVQIYTWKDATLKEMTDLIKGVKSTARRREARLEFAFVYPDKRGKNVVRKVGTTYSRRRAPDDRRTLEDLKFETGDFLAVAIHDR